MAYGARTGVPLGLGILASVLCLLFFSERNYEGALKKCSQKLGNSVPKYIFSAEKWEVKQKKPSFTSANTQSEAGKVIRSRFAATELGIRERLVVIIFGQSALSTSLTTLLSPHVPKVHIFMEASRVDQDMCALPNLTPYRQNGQHAHVHVLNAMFNLTFHDNYDWFLLVPDTTYVNPFALNRLVNEMSWNKAQSIGHSRYDAKCTFDAGILLSNPAVQLLIQERNLCSSITASSDQLALEMCIQHATNLSCQDHEGKGLPSYRWWHFEDSSETGLAIHERVLSLQDSRSFNTSVTVSSLLSDLDARALHAHFVNVEMDKIDMQMAALVNEIKIMEHELAIQKLANQSLTVNFLSNNVENDLLSWPAGLPHPLKPSNRYQVHVWEYFTEDRLFKNWPNYNVETLSESDALDIAEILVKARRKVETSENGQLIFVRLKNGYRSFNALRGMQYIVDLEYRRVMDDNTYRKFSDEGKTSIILKRIHLCRPIFSSELLESVPYVKEDTDITLVIPVETAEEIDAARQLFHRHALLCEKDVASGNNGADDANGAIDSRQTRIVVAARGIDAFTTHQLNTDLSLLKRRCKSRRTEATLLVLKSNDGTKVEDGTTSRRAGISLRMAALDEAVDHYGQQVIYVLVTPFSDYQREFLDRVRISTIRRYQVFSPIPFAEFNPLVAKTDEILEKSTKVKGFSASFDTEHETLETMKSKIEQISKILRHSVENLNLHEWPIMVHKDHGFFDVNDFRVFCVYGADYLLMREKFSIRHNKRQPANMNTNNNPHLSKGNDNSNDFDDLNSNSDNIAIEKIEIESAESQNINKNEFNKAEDHLHVEDEIGSEKQLDIFDLFLAQDQIHVLRAVEPSLRVRYHRRSCENVEFDADLHEQCSRSARDSFGTKGQMANLTFRNLKNENGVQLDGIPVEF